MQFNKSIVKYPSIARFPGGASSDLLPNLQNPANPLPLLGDLDKVPKVASRVGDTLLDCELTMRAPGNWAPVFLVSRVTRA
jgi:hypothetical protein